MAKARLRERFTALFFAILFLGSTVAVGILVIVDNVQRSKQNNQTTNQQATTTNAQGENKNVLQGTQLANFTPVASTPQLQKIDTVAGTGDEVTTLNQKLTMDYTGAVAATGIIFQSSKDSGQPLKDYPLTDLIKGWQEGVPGMKVGGTRRLIIPAAQAYGANPPAGSGIPANADLVFDMTLISVKN